LSRANNARCSVKDIEDWLALLSVSYAVPSGDAIKAELMVAAYCNGLSDCPSDVLADVMLGWHRHAVTRFLPSVQEIILVVTRLNLPRATLIAKLVAWDTPEAIRVRLDRLERDVWVARSDGRHRLAAKIEMMAKAERAKLAEAIRVRHEH